MKQKDLQVGSVYERHQMWRRITSIHQPYRDGVVYVCFEIVRVAPGFSWANNNHVQRKTFAQWALREVPPEEYDGKDLPPPSTTRQTFNPTLDRRRNPMNREEIEEGSVYARGDTWRHITHIERRGFDWSNDVIHYNIVRVPEGTNPRKGKPCSLRSFCRWAHRLVPSSEYGIYAELTPLQEKVTYQVSDLQREVLEEYQRGYTARVELTTQEAWLYLGDQFLSTSYPRETLTALVRKNLLKVRPPEPGTHYITYVLTDQGKEYVSTFGG